MRKLIAQQGDVARLDGVLSNAALRRARSAQETKFEALHDDAGPVCKGAIEISPDRAKRLETLFASRDVIRAATPQVVRDLILDQEDDVPQVDDDDDANVDPETAAYHKRKKLERADLAHLLAGNMAMYIEWPHVDRRFKQVYATMAGRYAKHWASRSDSDGDPNLDEKAN